MPKGIPFRDHAIAYASGAIAFTALAVETVYGENGDDAYRRLDDTLTRKLRRIKADSVKDSQHARSLAAVFRACADELERTNN